MGRHGKYHTEYNWERLIDDPQQTQVTSWLTDPIFLFFSTGHAAIGPEKQNRCRILKKKQQAKGLKKRAGGRERERERKRKRKRKRKRERERETRAHTHTRKTVREIDEERKQ